MSRTKSSKSDGIWLYFRILKAETRGPQNKTQKQTPSFKNKRQTQKTTVTKQLTPHKVEVCRSLVEHVPRMHSALGLHPSASET